MTEDEAQAVLADLEGSDTAAIAEAMDVLGVDTEEEHEPIDWHSWYRSMYRMWLMLIVVEGVAFGMMAWNRAYVAMPTIVWSIGIASFMTGRSYERRSNPSKRQVR